MASRAVESDKLSGLYLAKVLYFGFNLLILKAKSTIWRYYQIALNNLESLNTQFAIYRVSHSLL